MKTGAAVSSIYFMIQQYWYYFNSSLNVSWFSTFIWYSLNYSCPLNNACRKIPQMFFFLVALVWRKRKKLFLLIFSYEAKKCVQISILLTCIITVSCFLRYMKRCDSRFSWPCLCFVWMRSFFLDYNNTLFVVVTPELVYSPVTIHILHIRGWL